MRGAPERPPAKVRVGQPANLLLFSWAQQLDWAFGVSPLLVGSATQRKDWRDVDVRLVLPDDQYRERVGNPDPHAYLDSRRQVMCVAFSIWGQQATGLPIDFQFQSASDAARYDSEPRVALRPFYLTRARREAEDAV